MTGIFGVTGLPCAGKSLAAQLLADGVGTGSPGLLIKADDVGHQVLEQPDVRQRIRQRFGDKVADAGDAAEVRRAIAKRVFRSPADLEWLEQLIHPLVFDSAQQLIENNRTNVAVVEAALLFTGGLNALCDVIFIIEAHLDIRMVRASKRGWQPDELARREQRLISLFSPKAMAPFKKQIVRVRNDEDDGLLGERLEKALELHRSNKSITV